MGRRKGCGVDVSSVIGEVPGLVIISVVTGSLVGSMVVGGSAVLVTTTVGVCEGVVVSMVMLVSAGVG